MRLNLARVAVVLVMITGISGFNFAFNDGGIHSVFDMALHDVDTNVGIRADIGGAFIGLTLFMLLGLIRTSAAWLWPAVIVLACIMIVRIFGVFRYGYTDMQGLLIGVEIVMIALLSFGARTFASEKQSPRE